MNYYKGTAILFVEVEHWREMRELMFVEPLEVIEAFERVLEVKVIVVKFQREEEIKKSQKCRQN
jgi:hypothetical protein